MYFEAGELSLVEVDKGTTQRLELSMCPCITILLQNLVVTSFGSNMKVPPVLQMEATERKYFPSVGNTCAVRSSRDRVGKHKVPSCVAEMFMSSGKMSLGPFLVYFELGNGDSVFR